MKYCIQLYECSIITLKDSYNKLNYFTEENKYYL